ncbi:ABC transporter ATP-binding protein [Polycladomyces sp. WAk]|uniref:ABC transporter ATP-binding protein n=1 Tax=Polycladomyces zharkentensis TaxID=2807616 RepID=A0ABS2WFZ4_9BACL|nr:ABC transporter ATP-binding protein [Polycladomyces sp. WAk]MBN2908469.1 ABC transporter ATP-binding protein [Polycladomyces sp. WAk]
MTVLVMEQVSKRYRQTTAVDQVSVSLEKGEIVGVLGPDGAGKTTLLNLAAGMIPPTKGRIKREEEAVGFVPQHFGMYEELSIEENLHFYGQLNGIDKNERDERIAELLARIRLATFASRRAGQLSGGMKRKLAIAGAMLHRPGLMVLDEPTHGVDPVSRREVWEMIRHAAAEGAGVLVSTQYLDEADHCDRVLLLHRGRGLADGRPEALLRQFPYPVWVVREAVNIRSNGVRHLLQMKEVVDAYPRGVDLVVIGRDPSAGEALMRWLHETGAAREVGPVEETGPTMEDVLIRLIREQKGEGR